METIMRSISFEPGSPGHTCIVIDEASADDMKKIYKLAEGYMPAQSIYILSNRFGPGISPWYRLAPGIITTSSYQFVHYELRKFE